MPANPKDPNFPGRRVDWSAAAFETRAIRAGQDPDAETGSVIVPIYQTSTYRHRAVGDFNGYEYSRTDNPTRTALQSSVASLEGAAGDSRSPPARRRRARSRRCSTPATTS